MLKRDERNVSSRRTKNSYRILIEYYIYIANKVYQGHINKKYVQERRSDLVEA